jgi:hypothetical protein
MANTTSGSYSFDKNYSIDDIIEDAYERIGMQGVSGYQIKICKEIFKSFYFLNGVIENYILGK